MAVVTDVVHAAGFVGRARVVKRLTGALDRGLAGRFQFILVSGEAGIGKTTLLSRLVEHASAGGATAVWATCWHADQAPGLSSMARGSWDARVL